MFVSFKENSLKEWSYKSAITIETYDGYDPIPVPFNIFYSVARLLKLVKKERKEERNKEKVNVLKNTYRTWESVGEITNLINNLNIPCAIPVSPVHGRVSLATKFAVPIFVKKG